MLKKLQVQQDESSGHDWPFLVPMLDIVFILLFFFIIMSNSAQYVFDVKLPKPDDSYENPYQDLNPEKTVKIFIKADTFMINEENVGEAAKLKSMVQELTQGNKEMVITVASDKEVELQRFLDIMTYLKAQGYKNVQILMEKS